MYCEKCGNKVVEGAAFCTNCGNPLKQRGINESAHLRQNETKESSSGEEGKKPKSNGKTIKIVAAVLAVVLIGAVGGYFAYTNSFESREEVSKWLKKAEKDADNLIFTDDEKEDFDDLAETLHNDLDEKRSRKILSSDKNELAAFLEKIEKSSKDKNNEHLAALEKVSEEESFGFEMDSYDDTKADVESLIGKGQYRAAEDKMVEWDNYVELVKNPNYNCNIEVRQIDLSEYPKVHVYLDVTDDDDNFVEGLDKSAFLLNEGKKVGGKFKRATIAEVSQLNKSKGLSIGLVSDISGSMDENFDEAQSGMISFLNSVNPDIGDEVELTTFSDDSYTVGPFGTSIADMTGYIEELETDGGTRLYDTLLNEIERVNSRTNAKCVVGFTDGYDNVSNSDVSDVIDLANRYQIPVYLIGIGYDVDTESLQRIARETGGQYWNIDSLSRLSEIYEEAYSQEKECYELVFESQSKMQAKAAYFNILMRNSDGDAAIAKNCEYSPYEFFDNMYSRFLIAGIDCQTKGERNLIDSGLITTSKEAYKDKECVAHQSQAAIDSGGVGANNSRIFEVLLYHDVINVKKNKDGSYILYGASNYDISKIKSFSKLNDKEKKAVKSMLGDVSGSDEVWVEENRSLYEKLTLVKDSDGTWKFDKRWYQREDGGDAIIVNDVYNAAYE